MKLLHWTLSTSALIFALSATVQAEEGNEFYNLDGLEGFDCEFDSGTPVDGDRLVKNTRLSLHGDVCNVFEIWVGPTSDNSEATRIPRSEIYPWHSCRFVNVMTQNKIDDYMVGYADDNEMVKIWGVCLDSDDFGNMVPTGYDMRVLKVDSD